jgi:RNA polymerase sigma-70 factor, ECF subfamily
MRAGGPAAMLARERVMDLGDRDNFAEQVVRNQHRVFAYIVTLLANRDDAEDVFQSTCLILWKKWEDYDPQRDFFAWACGVAHNEVRNMLRRSDRRRMHLSDDVLSQVAETRLKADALLEDRGQFLAMCIEKLSELQRQLVEDCYLGDRPIKAIAEEMGISPAAVTMRLQRIRKILFECVDSAVKSERGDAP